MMSLSDQLRRATRSRNVRLVALLLFICFAVSGVAWYRLSRLNPESDPLRYWMAEGARAYSRMDTVAASDEGAVRELITNAPVEDAEGLLPDDDRLLRSLHDVVAGFLIARFGAESPDEYLGWMQSRGYRFKSLEEFASAHGSLSDNATAVGVASDDLEGVFRALWDYGPSRRAMPDSLCTGSAAAVITIGWTNQNRFISRRPHGELGYDLWHGGAAGTCRFWMRPPVTRSEAAGASGTVAAQVGVIASVPGSARRPILVNAFLQPGTSKWWIDAVFVNNFVGTNDAWTCVEY